MSPPIHLRSLRHYNNAGICVPECYANRRFLDLDKCRLITTNDISQITCSRCIRLIQENLSKSE